jgi:hypothetical protein
MRALRHRSTVFRVGLSDKAENYHVHYIAITLPALGNKQFAKLKDVTQEKVDKQIWELCLRPLRGVFGAGGGRQLFPI